jgi:hypothetical protein
MIVRNKKTGKEYSISTSDWEIIKERKQSQLYTVVDASELTQKKTMPIEITQIITKSKPNNTQDEKPISENSNESTGVNRRRSGSKAV